MVDECVEVCILVGRVGERKVVTGTVRPDSRGHVYLVAVVPGGDPGMPDRYKRFRAFLGTLANGVEMKIGSGTSFHLCHVGAFLDKFGDAASDKNAIAKAHVARIVHPLNLAPHAHDAEVAMHAKRKECARANAALAVHMFLPASLDLSVVLDRIRAPNHGRMNVTTRLKKAMVEHHPDNVSRRNGCTVETVALSEEIFKVLNRYKS